MALLRQPNELASLLNYLSAVSKRIKLNDLATPLANLVLWPFELTSKIIFYILETLHRLDDCR